MLPACYKRAGWPTLYARVVEYVYGFRLNSFIRHVTIHSHNHFTALILGEVRLSMCIVNDVLMVLNGANTHPNLHFVRPEE